MKSNKGLMLIMLVGFVSILIGFVCIIAGITLKLSVWGIIIPAAFQIALVTNVFNPFFWLTIALIIKFFNAISVPGGAKILLFAVYLVYAAATGWMTFFVSIMGFAGASENMYYYMPMIVVLIALSPILLVGMALLRVLLKPTCW